ncbi:MAG: SBBP repeat-containing protein, partial [Thermodesulfobacteriota bacterium]|nr:SBBP repeat-containing protein [Thermodesulfobacteriota bacterium]
AVDVDGNVYVTGSSYGDSTSADYCTVSYDSDGNERWVQRYNGPGNNWDSASAIAVDVDGNVYVTGSSYGDSTSADYCTVSYDSDGNERWVQRYDGPGNSGDRASAIAVDVDSNVYVTGYSEVDDLDSDYCTVSYDSDGNERWVRIYDRPGNGECRASAIAVDASGNVYVTGYVTGYVKISIPTTVFTDEDYCTISYDSDGNERWVRRYDGLKGFWYKASAIAVDTSGNVYVTGYVTAWNSREGTYFYYCTVSYDSNGNKRWAQRHSEQLNDYYKAVAIAVDSSGNVYVTGRSMHDYTIYDYCTVSYDSNGNKRWVQKYAGPGYSYDFAFAIAVDGDGNIYVTGESFSDYCTIKYVGNPVKTLLEKAITAIDDLDDDDFKSGLLRGILLKRINSALSTYEKGFTNLALVQLKCGVIEKMDGCAKRGEPDAGFTLYEDDWLITCDAQNDLYPLIADVIDMIDFY